MELTKKIEGAIEAPLSEKGYDLVRVRIVDGKKIVLEIDIDRLDEHPVRFDDCISANRIISEILDVEDFIEGSYNLTISSPGDTRPIRKLSDFERFRGKVINIELLSPVDGKRKIVGKLAKVEQISDDTIVYLNEECNTEPVELGILYSNIKKAYIRRAF